MVYDIPEGSLQESIFMDKYAYPGETKWKQLAKRVSKAVALPEKREVRDQIEKKFFEAINSADFCPGGRILFGAGRNKYNMLNCYVLDPEDSVESIGKTIADMYKISCAGGGVGFNFSKIRPKGDDIQNIQWSAPGSISVMKMINEIGEHVRAGKNRRTALMSILEVSHPDFLEFLSVKLDRKELTNFNISVAINNRFISAVENDEDWHFTFEGRHNKYFCYNVERTNEKGEVDTIMVVAKDEDDAVGRADQNHKVGWTDTFANAVLSPLKAKDIWERLLDNAVESGEPGIFNVDLANEFTNVSYFEEMPATNPCGEITLPAYGNCCLGHVNLANMVDMDGNIDYRRLARTVRVGVRFLDNVLTANTFPIQECEDVGLRSRRIGLGVTGLHYFLIKAGFKYGSEACLEFLERLFSTIRNEAYKASMYLAREKGSFPKYDFKKLKDEKFMKTIPARIRADIKKNGLRNAVMLTVAPTGTISMVLGVSTGLEPIFAPVYMRKWKTSTPGVFNENIVIDPLFKEMYLRGRDLTHCVGAYDVTPEEHMKVQSVVQAHIDSAVSKTCNLPSDFKPETLYEDLLSQAHDLKGVTFYRAGSRGNEPLTTVDHTTLDLDALITSGKLQELASSIDTCIEGVCEI
jgi:ribonucleoside-diphosphate reductase alpha chain